MNTSHQSFDANLFYIVPNLITSQIIFTSSVSIYVFQYRCKTPFVTHVSLSLVLILNEAVCLLVDGVVSQMHAQIIQVAPLGRHVFFSRESGEPFLVNETAQRIDARDKHVYSEIEFQIINQIRFVQIPLGNVVLSLNDPVAVSSQEYTFALAIRFRLNDKSLGTLVVELLPEILRICRQNPSLWKEIILIGKILIHQI